MHVGCMVPGHVPGTAQPGPICLEAQRTGSGNFLANLALFPGTEIRRRNNEITAN